MTIWENAPLIILCHNVFWFQGVPFETDQPGDPDDRILESLVDIYGKIDADVLCLQEIQNGETFQMLRDALRYDGHYTAGSSLIQYGGATFWRSGSVMTPANSSDDPPQRFWQVVESQGVIIRNLHLPSGRQLGPEAAASRRLEELNHATAKVPDVVLGDFNEQPGGRVSDFLRERGYVDAAVLTGRDSVPPSIGAGRGDQIWVHESVQDRLTDYGVLSKRDLVTSVEGKTSLSDHLPLWVQLDLGRNDK